MIRRIGWVLPGLAVLLLAAFAPEGASAASNWVVRLSAGSTAQSRAMGAPTAPTAVTATCNTFIGIGNRIDVGWAAVTKASSYQVFQSKNSGAYTSVGTVTSPTVTYSDTNLAVGTYSYEIKAFFGANWASPFSAASPTHTITQPLVFACT